MRFRNCATPLVCLAALAVIVDVSGCSSQTSEPFNDDAGGGSGGSSGSSGGSSGSSGGFPSSSSGSGSGSTSGGSSSGFPSSSGSSGSTSSSSGSTSSSSGSSSGPACAVTSPGGLVLTGGYLSTAAGNPGMGGYAFAYEDMEGAPPTGSEVCLEGCPQSPPATTINCSTSTALCAHGVLGESVATNAYAAFGGGLGFNLNQPMASMTAMAFAATGSGIAYTLSSLPAGGVRVQIDHGGATYCAPATAASGTAAWASFNTKCYDTPPDGVALTGAPADATQIEFQMVSTATSITDDFCLTAVSFAP